MKNEKAKFILVVRCKEGTNTDMFVAFKGRLSVSLFQGSY